MHDHVKPGLASIESGNKLLGSYFHDLNASVVAAVRAHTVAESQFMAMRARNQTGYTQRVVAPALIPARL